MTKRKVLVELPKEPPTVIIKFTEAGPKVELIAWQHAVPISQLDGIDHRIMQAIHAWKARFLQAESAGKVNAPTRREIESDTPTERRAS